MTSCSRPNQNVVGTKWVFHNKQDEHGVVIRNKARLVAKGYSQVEGLDFDETCEHYSFVSSIEPHRVEEALQDSDWVLAMQEELNNFTRNKV